MYSKVASANLSMPSAVALYLQREWAKSNGSPQECILDEINHEILTEIETCILGLTLRSPNESILKKRERELYLIQEPEDLLSNQFDFFCERFRRGLGGKKTDTGYRNLRDSLYEISDNVVSHAGVTKTSSSFGIAGYEITATGACFTVCDTGCGFVESLTSNERWKDRITHARAISAVVLEQATRRSGETCGSGFKGLFSALVQINSVTFLRSGDCLAEILAAKEGPQISFHAGNPMGGSQISVFFSRTGSPNELFH